MNAIESAPIAASVVSLLVRGFSAQPVAEQLKLKERIASLLAGAISPLPAASRILVDAPDGLVAVMLDHPVGALEVAQRAQAGAADLSLCIGVNHGPVKLAADSPELFGDGIVAAVTLAKLATRGKILVSRSFRDVLEAVAPHRATEIRSIGAFTDASVRTHDLFAVDPRAAGARRWRLIGLGALAASAILAAGIGTRMVRSAARRPAIIRLEINPLGDIFVDGELQGRSPPLERLEVTPERHTIEVRNPPHPPLRLLVNLKPAEELTVTHTFVIAPKKIERPKKDKKQEEDVWGSIRRRLGL